MPSAILDNPAPSGTLARRLAALPAAPLLLVDGAPLWNEALASGTRWLPWSAHSCSSKALPDVLERAAGGRAAGAVWWPDGPRRLALPAGWRWLPPPWTRLARWYLEGLPLSGRHVTLLAPAHRALDPLCAWLMRQGASVTWCDGSSRHLWSCLRLSDIALVFAGFDWELEARHLAAGATLIDFRPGHSVGRSALQITLGSYADAESGSLTALLPCLAMGWLAQQEGPSEGGA